MKKSIMSLILSALLVASSHTYAGIKYEDGDKYVKIGGRIQLQYHLEDPDDDNREDELKFRRFRPYIEGSLHKGWKGKFQWDMGKNTFAIKDAYMAYSGLDACNIIVGNHNFPFSRELLTSSKEQQLVERTFVGDHNYGTPDRQVGIHLTGNLMDKKLAWGTSLGKGVIDPDDKKLDFDTAVQFNAGDDWSEGEIVGARIDYFPLGPVKFSQGDFKSETKAGLGLAAFSWSNDNDNLDSARAANGKSDVDSVIGIEVSGAFRGYGLSIDVEYNQFDAELEDQSITSGLYENSKTTVENYAVEAGYMVLPGKVEVVAGYQSQDADGYADTWTRISGGLNYFIEKHDIKVQTTYRMGKNKDGKEDNNLDEYFIQCQYVF